jgi:hypothetical protein
MLPLFNEFNRLPMNSLLSRDGLNGRSDSGTGPSFQNSGPLLAGLIWRTPLLQCEFQVFQEAKTDFCIKIHSARYITS